MYIYLSWLSYKKTKVKDREIEVEMSQFQIWVLAFGTLSLLFSSAVADDVVVLTEDTFEKEVGQERGALVEFYAPW